MKVAGNEFTIGRLTIGYEAFRSGWRIYFERYGERIYLPEEASKDESLVRARAEILARMIDNEVGEECREVQAQAYKAGLESGGR